MDVDFIQLIITASSYSAILPLGLSIFNWKYLSFELKILSVYLLLFFLIDITALQLANNRVNNMHLLYAITVLEFTLFSWIYYKILKSAQLKKIVLVIATFFLIIVLLNLYKQGLSSYASVPRTLESIIFTVYPILYFYTMLKGGHGFVAEKDSMFWFNGGILFYFAGSLLFFSLSSYILEHARLDLQRNLFVTPAILNIVQKLLFAIAIWVSQRKK